MKNNIAARLKKIDKSYERALVKLRQLESERKKITGEFLEELARKKADLIKKSIT